MPDRSLPRAPQPKSEEGDPFWSELISETVIRRTQTAVSGVQEKRPRADGPSPPMRAARRELDAKDWAVLQVWAGGVCVLPEGGKSSGSEFWSISGKSPPPSKQ